MSQEYEHITELFPTEAFDHTFIPEELKELPRWVIWSLCKTSRSKDDDKPTKRPVRISRDSICGVDIAKWSSPDRQYTFDHCLSLYTKHKDIVNGLGFIPNPDDGIVVIDYDNCFPLKEADPRAKYLGWSIDNTFCEYSQSGNGAHLFLRGNLSDRFNDSAGFGVEIYPGKKQSFIAMTGRRYEDCPALLSDDQTIIDSHIEEFFAKQQEKKSGKSQQSGDYEIPDNIPNGNRNIEMTRLCGHLMSTLSDIREVFAKMFMYNQTLCETPLEQAEIVAIVESIQSRQVNKYAHLVENIYHVRTRNLWFDFSDMTELSADSLNISHIKEFTGKKGEKAKLASWLPKQQGFKQVADYTWSPMPYMHEERIITYEGRKLLNTWKGFAIEPKKGNVQPWLDHLLHLIPEDDYRRALLWWIAFTIQCPDQKASWQPIILGISGAGKDGLFRPIASMLGSAFKSIGNKDIKSDYDDGLIQTKLLHISEAAGLRGNAVEFYKRITATESSDIQMLNPKSAAKIWQRNICNVLVITNNLDAMKFDKEERRAFVLKSPNIMTGAMQIAYFDNWLDVGGASHLFDYLLNYDLSEFKPGMRPYRTTHFDALFDITKSDAEIGLEEILEPYEIALPELCKHLLKSDDNYSTSKILVWLQSNGWARWDEGNESRRIKRSVDGKQCQPKSRNWYVRKGSKFQGSNPAVMCVEVERVEALLIKHSKF